MGFGSATCILRNTKRSNCKRNQNDTFEKIDFSYVVSVGEDSQENNRFDKRNIMMRCFNTV